MKQVSIYFKANDVTSADRKEYFLAPTNPTAEGFQNAVQLTMDDLQLKPSVLMQWFKFHSIT